MPDTVAPADANRIPDCNSDASATTDTRQLSSNINPTEHRYDRHARCRADQYDAHQRLDLDRLQRQAGSKSGYGCGAGDKRSSSRHVHSDS